MAYSEKDNIAYTKDHDIKLIAKLNPLITQGSRRKEVEFQVNKDTVMVSVQGRSYGGS